MAVVITGRDTERGAQTVASVGVADAPVAAALHLKDIRKDDRLG